MHAVVNVSFRDSAKNSGKFFFKDLWSPHGRLSLLLNPYKLGVGPHVHREAWLNYMVYREKAM